jgi:hypothetical protein
VLSAFIANSFGFPKLLKKSAVSAPASHAFATLILSAVNRIVLNAAAMTTPTPKAGPPEAFSKSDGRRVGVATSPDTLLEMPRRGLSSQPLDR